jgi:uncharacterized protein involved in exopolysaccharide biosynthesis
MRANELFSSPLKGRTVSDVITPLFRYRWAALLAFVSVLAGAIVGISMIAPEYEASMKILVKRERMDPVMTPAPDAPAQASADVREDELNSEVELLKSRDLLESVAVAAGLVAGGKPDVGTDRVRVSEAVSSLRSDLTIAALRRTTVIDVTYKSPDPVRAERVLAKLADLYIEKHIAVHRPAGAFEFFQEQTQALTRQLETAQARLTDFTHQVRTVSPAAERDATLQQLATFEASLQQTRALIAEADRRVATLDAQIQSTPSRQTTQIQTAEDGDLIRTWKAKLLELELKRNELLRKFTPGYLPVQQVTEEIAEVRTALHDAESRPVTSQTTDQNPTHQWLRDERARVTAERDALAARTTALAATIREYRDQAKYLDDARVEQEALVRDVKSAEAAYTLYQHKQEEARISDALDRIRIANVSLLEAPVVPPVPSQSGRALLLAIGFVAAAVAGVLVAYALHALDPYLRTADQVTSVLGIPVLATLPAEAR